MHVVMIIAVEEKQKDKNKKSKFLIVSHRFSEISGAKFRLIRFSH
ncbi:hypothetical protein LEP1GSC137_2298 [Leptospira borgpetersenii str. Noumea 25]|uniref:Uncharacterized protein n=3 Tax=Leptospira borgpetersenii TaxID=174 RepID=A0A0S2IU52_LEPBO|nr:hypothetical protein LBBP_02967 [Leptospira borgpetersenii serovar Ballum]EMO11803.1 hypothetical protein LEP1GSC137_2298 [Leptospira borgpetersenii str. Noumea 25]